MLVNIYLKLFLFLLFMNRDKNFFNYDIIFGFRFRD